MMSDRRRAAFGLLIAAQAAHSVEEYVTRMYDVFAPAEFVSRLFSSNLQIGFAIFNGVLVLFGIWCYVARVRTAHPNERAYAWFWTVLEAGNGAGHLLLSLVTRSYFPGVATAPVLLALAYYLGAGLVGPRENRHEAV